MTYTQRIQVLQFEADLYKLYISQISKLKEIMESFNSKMVNVRINERLSQAFKSECTIYIIKDADDLTIKFVAKKGSITIGKSIVHAYNHDISIYCKNAIVNRRLNYHQIAIQIDLYILKWKEFIDEIQNADYETLLNNYQHIIHEIYNFNNQSSSKLLYSLNLYIPCKYNHYSSPKEVGSNKFLK